MSRHSLVRTALIFYGLLFGAALLWAAVSGDSLLYASDAAAGAGVRPWRDVVLGAVAAAAVIAISQAITARSHVGERLARALAQVLGPLPLRHCVLLAAVSGVAEEAFFRGALQPRVGLVAASVLFGLAHFVPRREFLPWTVFSLAAGFLLGGLFEATGNLVAPVTAHALVNAVNLNFLATRYAS
jgi:membrane protease YdiL (CAAX protease family)